MLVDFRRSTFLIGVTVGWAWKPKWVDSKRDKLASCISKLLDSSSSLKGFAFAPCLNSPLARSPNCQTWLLENSMEKKQPFVQPNEYEDCSTSQLKEECSEVAHLVTEEDLKHLYQLVEVKDGGPTWMRMMDCSNPSIVYQAWRREPKLNQEEVMEG
ncbi:hypothetical protein K2173_023866 [Erythroxylum novogranatense]|uniref:Uncharacterized protein n=1 Tax=Erythroxylum novogranatense TaxID=1862640 RepID=A0AAV8TQZ4_9ROSI|nr:hypothetical protein K2173_023866 [Erythroxylum novogranatense]